MVNVLILKAGDTHPAVRIAFGDYESWFVQALGHARRRYTLVHAHRAQALPRPTDFDAVIVTGSPSSLTIPEPWMRKAADLLLQAGDGQVPVLGVCFGHQLLGHAFDVAVERSPRGREIGSIDVTLTEAGRADPLFAGLGPTFTVQATHEDVVPKLPRGATLLAHNAHCSVQAMRLGKTLWGVQFHPEITAEIMRALIVPRVEGLKADAQARGQDPEQRLAQLFAGLRPSPAGRRILENFLRLVE